MASVFFYIAMLSLLLTVVVALTLGSWAFLASAPLTASGLVLSCAWLVIVCEVGREASARQPPMGE